MRAVMILVVLCSLAHADDKALKPYVGQVVLSPDAPPTERGKLPAYLAVAFDKTRRYEFIKWDVHFVGVLAKPADKVTFAVAGVGAGKELISIELGVANQIVIGHFAPTTAAGFAAGGHYDVTLVAGKTVVGKAELVLRE